MSTPQSLAFLCLEDNPLDAELTERQLRNAGFEFSLTVADNRLKFEEAFHSNPYDLILADYSLPDFDGLTALAIVRAKYGKLPFIFVSGAMGEDIAVEAMLRGATDYVLKTRLDRLKLAVQRALAEHDEYLRREKAEAQLRVAEGHALAHAERQGVLLQLLQQQRTSASAESLMLSASRQLTDYLQVARAGFYEVAKDGTFNFLWQWRSGAATTEAVLPESDFDHSRLHRYRQGEVVSMRDILAVENSNTAALMRIGIRSFLGVPIFRAGEWRAGFYVAHDEPRDWTEQEASFIQEVAEVTWESVERARAVAALATSEQRLRTAAETANLGSWDLNLKTGRMICSDQCKANFGRSKDQDFHYADLREAIHPEDRPSMGEAVEKAIANREIYRAEYRNLWPDGSLHWVIAAGRAQYDEAGLPIRMTGFTLDVTERHKAQQALLQSEKLAAVGRLASSIAHEINNPLESVTNLLYLATTAVDIATVKGYLETADLELRRVAAITSQTLRFHRQNGEPKEVCASDLFDSVLGIYQRRLNNGDMRLALRMRAHNSFKCLDGEIRQVLNNLVGNAIDAMRPGGCLALRSRDGSNNGMRGVWLTVADNGSGMTRTVQEKVFDAFFTTKGINGTGLGLWVSQEITHRHGGALIVRSSQSPRAHGSVFSLFLPSSK